MLQNGRVLDFNSQGLIGGFRNERDGVAYFGCKKRPKRIIKTVRRTEILNDFVIPNLDKKVDKRNRGRHFKIWFDPQYEQYKIKDLGIGFGCFLKIVEPFTIR